METSPPSGARGDGSPSMPSLSNFQFTFRATSSGSNSFIEADSLSDRMDSVSLSESVQNFPEEFGRTYHAYRAGSYAYPNDLPEQERLALQAEIITELFEGRLFFSPWTQRSPPRNILDIATGTGDWAIRIGDMFPQAEVVATDLSPIQPEDVPPNVNFYVEDSGEEWEYSQKFDFIHSRITVGCWYSYKDQIIQQSFDNLNPGGWFEAAEVDATWGCDDGTVTEDHSMLYWMRDMTVASAAMSRPISGASSLKRWMEEVGFVEVHEKVVKVPTNGWPKNDKLKLCGRLWEQNFAAGISGFSLMLFNRVFGRTAEEVEVALTNVRKELSDHRIHAYCPIFVVWGRKPYPGEVARDTLSPR